MDNHNTGRLLRYIKNTGNDAEYRNYQSKEGNRWKEMITLIVKNDFISYNIK